MSSATGQTYPGRGRALGSVDLGDGLIYRFLRRLASKAGLGITSWLPGRTIPEEAGPLQWFFAVPMNYGAGIVFLERCGRPRSIYEHLGVSASIGLFLEALEFAPLNMSQVLKWGAEQAGSGIRGTLASLVRFLGRRPIGMLER